MQQMQAVGKSKIISIHALRVEGDPKRAKLSAIAYDFYPRPPGGGRPWGWGQDELTILDFYPRPPGGGRQPQGKARPRVVRIFLSTPSGWRATMLFLGMKIIAS